MADIKPDIENSSEQFIKKAATYMEHGQQFIYISTGFAFLVIGIVIFIYSIFQFVVHFANDNLHAFYILINDLMLLLIIMEVMETIINHLRENTILLEPFLYMGIIAAVRKILGAGAKIVLVEDVSETIFNRYVWDLGINAAVILSISIALFIYSSRLKPKAISELQP